ncbi:MAG: ATP-binding protein [Clostridiales bacterium]|nr:ATP-binding protein [Clostridiales bacterium]MDR2751271.1 ATP-binding protein [Clostridiales bacterium]
MTKEIKIFNDSFEDLRRKNCYYIDKSMFIKEIFRHKGHVNLITRPSRFGKSLNLSMLKSYLEIGADPALFEGLTIEAEREIHDKHFGKYPVLYMSFADIAGENFNDCMKCLAQKFSDYCINLKKTLDCSKLDVYTQENIEWYVNPSATLDDSSLKATLDELTSTLYYYYGKEVVILIDDYDSMLINAIGKGYENAISDFLSGFFGRIFKGNTHVGFVVLTGCVRIVTESIVSGANNVIVSYVSHKNYSDCFGLTEAEVEKALDDFGLFDAMGAFQEWYKGYLFSDKCIYNTSSVMSCCKDLLGERTANPQKYWISNSSSSNNNKILVDILNKAERALELSNLENLVFGGTINLSLKTVLTLKDFDTDFWSVLVHSGYLTPCMADSNDYRIPNKEIKNAFVESVITWIQGRVKEELRRIVVSSIWKQDSETLQETLIDILADPFIDKISFRQAYPCHLILLGLMADGEVKSNGDSGNGRYITLANSKDAAIIELKKSYADLYMLSDALGGIMQIRDRFCGQDFNQRGFNVIHYGMSFCKKQCFAILESNIDQAMIESAIGDMEAAVWGLNWIIDKKMRETAKRRKKPVPLPPLIKEPDSEAWFPGREQKLKDLRDVLELEKLNFNFALLLETTTKLLDDLRWLLKTEVARDDSRTLLEALLTDAS